MTETQPNTMPITGDFHVDRDSLVRETLLRMASETRRGTRSAIDDLPDGVRYSIGLLKAQGLKHREIHDELIIALRLKPDDEDIPNYHALNRWLDRFGFVLGLVRSAERSRLACAIDIAKTTGDLREGAVVANKLILGKVIETMAECPDLRDLSNGQLANLISALSVATRAGIDDRKLDKAIELADARIVNLTTRTHELQEKIDRQTVAAQQVQAAIQAEAAKSPDGRVDASSVMAALHDALLGIEPAAASQVNQEGGKP